MHWSEIADLSKILLTGFLQLFQSQIEAFSQCIFQVFPVPFNCSQLHIFKNYTL